MSEIKSCGFLIVRGKPVADFLLMRHTNRWDLPKGHVDLGENELQCALRELEEETSITTNEIEIDDDDYALHRDVIDSGLIAEANDHVT